MNLNQLLNMIFRMVLRRFINMGITGAMGAVFGRGRRRGALPDDHRLPPEPARQDFGRDPPDPAPPPGPDPDPNPDPNRGPDPGQGLDPGPARAVIRARQAARVAARRAARRAGRG